MGEYVFVVGGGEVDAESIETFRARRKTSFFLSFFLSFISNMETEPQRRK